MKPHRSTDATLAMLCALALAGCLTVAPKPITDTQASFDGGAQNSGLVGFATNEAGVYMVITPHARARYNALIAAGYGTNFLPAITTDYGITDGTNMTLEALADFVKMNRIRKSAP